MTINILLVDDTKTVLMFEKMLLAGTGFGVAFAENGLEALDKLDDFEPDLILLDIMMPVMNGIEFCKKVRSLKKHAHIPIIVVTTKAEKEMVNLAYSVGCTDYLTKPLQKVKLLSKIKQHLSVKN